MMYQRGEHGMEQAHGGYSGGMRRSQSLVQGLFGWISPFPVSYTHLTLPTNREV